MPKESKLQFKPANIINRILGKKEDSIQSNATFDDHTLHLDQSYGRYDTLKKPDSHDTSLQSRIFSTHERDELDFSSRSKCVESTCFKGSNEFMAFIENGGLDEDDNNFVGKNYPKIR
jgi:hypothetical protein